MSPGRETEPEDVLRLLADERSRTASVGAVRVADCAEVRLG